MSKAVRLFAATFLAAGLAATSVAAQPASPDPTKDFLQQAAGSDEYEITAGRVAVIEAQDPQVRSFAQQMIQDHTRTSQDLQSAATRSGREPPLKAMSGDQARMVLALQSLRGADFDKTYMTQQVLAHTQALVVQGGYARRGQDDNVRAVAQSTVPLIQGHLQMAQQMKAQLGGM
jgi:putative membrane protein